MKYKYIQMPKSIKKMTYNVKMIIVYGTDRQISGEMEINLSFSCH